MEPVAEMPLGGGDERQGTPRGEEGLPATDAGPGEVEALQIGDVIGGGAKRDGIGGRQAGFVLAGGAVETAGVAAAVDEQAGPGPRSAQPAARRKIPAIELGSAKAGLDPAGQVLQQPGAPFPGSFRRRRREKPQAGKVRPVLQAMARRLALLQILHRLVGHSILPGDKTPPFRETGPGAFRADYWLFIAPVNGNFPAPIRRRKIGPFQPSGKPERRPAGIQRIRSRLKWRLRKS
jgi:hypothetical protein